MKLLRKILVAVMLGTGVVGVMTVAPSQAQAEATVTIYGPYPTADARNAAANASGRSWQGDYVTEPPPGVPGVTVVGYRGPGYYWW